MRRRHMFYRASHLFLVSILLAVVSLSIAGCTNKEDTVNKLDSRLTGLINAEKRGETESFAHMAGFDLVDGSVKVVIIYKAGQCEKVTDIVSRLGTITSEADRHGQIGALIPITSLTALAEEESISRIREPEKPETN